MNNTNQFRGKSMTAVATGMLMMLLGVSQVTHAQDSTGAEKKKVIKTKHVRIEVYDRANGQTDTMVREYVIEDDGTGDKLRMEQMKQMELQVQQLEAQREQIEENAHQQEIEIEQQVEKQMEDLERQLETMEKEIEQKVIRINEEEHHICGENCHHEKSVVINTKEEDKWKTVEQSWFVMDLGWNVWLTENTFDLSEDYKLMELDRGKSVNFHLGIIQQGVNLYKGKLRFVYGVGIEYNNYRFKNNIDLQSDSRPLSFAVNTDRNYNKNKLVSLHATMPFMLNFKSSVKEDEDAFKLAAGVQLGYLMSSHVKQKWGDRGQKEKRKTKGDYGMSDYRYGYVVQFGYGDLNIYAKYYPTPVFKENVGPMANTACLGLVLTPF